MSNNKLLLSQTINAMFSSQNIKVPTKEKIL